MMRAMGRGEEVGSGPLLLPWRQHPDAAAAVAAKGVGKVELTGERRRKRRKRERSSPTLTTVTSEPSSLTYCIVGRW